jgi:hypothetical protein
MCVCVCVCVCVYIYIGAKWRFIDVWLPRVCVCVRVYIYIGAKWRFIDVWLPRTHRKWSWRGFLFLLYFLKTDKEKKIEKTEKLCGLMDVWLSPKLKRCAFCIHFCYCARDVLARPCWVSGAKKKIKFFFSLRSFFNYSFVRGTYILLQVRAKCSRKLPLYMCIFVYALLLILPLTLLQVRAKCSRKLRYMNHLFCEGKIRYVGLIYSSVAALLQLCCMCSEPSLLRGQNQVYRPHILAA